MHAFTVFNNGHNSESFYFSSIKDDISKTVDLLIMGEIETLVQALLQNCIWIGL